ncbi:hypothetical protein CL622_05260 [archaeon]|nr:hypothetical protein [archaeon]|tara:strand:+ start:634 stop:1257 length:624 start_codon:yes stop_codon:yes gene_type:complete
MGLFRKKEFIQKQEFNLLHERLHGAFSKVRMDFTEVLKQMTTFKKNNQNLSHESTILGARISALEGKIDFLQKTFLNFQNSTSIPKLESAEQIAHEEEGPEIDYFQQLTQTQLAIMGTLLKLIMISKKKWISVKSIANEYYPNNDYRNVKGILSQYTGILLEFNLIKKKTIGLLMYTALTQTGEKFCKENSEKLLSLVKDLKSHQVD